MNTPAAPRSRGRFALGFASGAAAVLAIVLIAAQQNAEPPAPDPEAEAARTIDPFANQPERAARFLLAVDPRDPFDGTLVGISGQFVALRRTGGTATEIYPVHQVITIWLQAEERRSRQLQPRPRPQEEPENENQL